MTNWPVCYLRSSNKRHSCTWTQKWKARKSSDNWLVSEWKFVSFSYSNLKLICAQWKTNFVRNRLAYETNDLLKISWIIRCLFALHKDIKSYCVRKARIISENSPLIDFGGLLRGVKNPTSYGKTNIKLYEYCSTAIGSDSTSGSMLRWSRETHALCRSKTSFALSTIN